MAPLLKSLLLTSLIYLISASSYSQNGWIWQNPLPQGNDMSNLQFVNSTTAYALCFNSVMKSTNAGSNWSIYYTGHSQNNTSLHFINETTGFVVSDTGIVLKTVNGGVNWSVISNMHQKNFHKTYFLNSETGYLIRHNDIYGNHGTALYRTSNGGVSWNVLLEDSTISINDIKFADMLTGYFGGHLNQFSNSSNYLKIFKTTNSGITFDSLHTGFIFPIIGIEIKNNVIFIYGGRSFPGMYGLIYSTNGGLNWLQSDLKKTLKDVSYLNANNFYATEAINGSSVLLYKSTNNGINWNSVTGDMKGYDFEFLNTSTGVTVGPMGQIHKTTNSGSNWLPQTSTIADYMNSADFVNENTGYACDEYKLFKTTNGGNNWNSLFTAYLYVIDFVDANTGYFGGEHSLYKTTNGGATITDITFANMPGKLTEIQFLDANTGFILGKYNTAWKTTNGGINWSLISGYGTGSHYCLKFCNENLGFIGLYIYNIGSGISKTTNGGLNWSFMPIPEAGDYIWDFYFLNSVTGFFTADGKIFRTTNAGGNWSQVFEIFPHYEIYSIQFPSETIGYATFAWGKMVKTTDAGSTWTVHNSITDNWFTDLYFTDINTGYFVGSNGVILKTTNGGGSPIGIEPISSNIPNSFELFQNYPNPFNPVTTIRFTIPNNTSKRNELTTLKIFDILGKEISVPVSEILSPGEYEISWDASGYPSGVYFVTLSNGSRSTSLKIVLVR